MEFIDQNPISSFLGEGPYFIGKSMSKNNSIICKIWVSNSSLVVYSDNAAEVLVMFLIAV